MKYFLLFFFTLQTLIFPTVFQLSTIVDNQQLVPVIKINGKIVIKVKDVGTKQVFSSSFERSEKIYKSLQQIGDQKSNLNRIRIRRNKADYVAYVDNIEVYRVTPSDVIGSDLTVYQMASLWRENIVEAIQSSNSEAPFSSNEVDETPFSISSVPLVSFLTIFSNNSVFVMVIQFIVFILVQVLAIFLTFHYFNRQQKLVFEDFTKRMKKFQTLQTQDKHQIASLEYQLTELVNKLDIEDADNVSNINS